MQFSVKKQLSGAFLVFGQKAVIGIICSSWSKIATNVVIGTKSNYLSKYILKYTYALMARHLDSRF